MEFHIEGLFLSLVACLVLVASDVEGALWDEAPVRTAEPILFIQTQDGAPEGRLLFKPKRLLRAYAFTPDREFSIADFSLEGRKIVYVGKAGIPHLTADDLVSARKAGNYSQPHADGTHFILYGETHVFENLQIHFDYETDERWTGTVPQDQSRCLPHLQQKIKNGESIVLTTLGDSITQGSGSTAWSRIPPMQPPYRDLLAKALRQASGGRVTLHNLAVGGKTAAWGVGQAQAVAATRPDLLLIAFGMNDSSGRRPAADFINDITTIIREVRALSESTEYLVVSGMTPVPQWAHSHLDYLESYHHALNKLAGPHVAFGDVRTPWLYVLNRKNYFDLTANGINHPNDFGHRLYADVLVQTILGNTKNTNKDEAE